MFVSISSEQIWRFLGFPNFSRTLLQNSQRFARKCPTFFVVTPWYLYRNYDFLLLLCEGCESKKCKIPDMRAHAHAWAGNWRLIFYLVFLIWWEDCFVLLIFPLQHQAFQKFLLDVLDNMYPFWRFRVHVLDDMYPFWCFRVHVLDDMYPFCDTHPCIVARKRWNHNSF